MFRSLFDLDWCTKTNILTRDNVVRFSSKQVARGVSFSNAYENMAGENLTRIDAYVDIVFGNHICVSEVLVQTTAPDRRPSNVAQIELVYKDMSEANIKSHDGDVIVLRSPEDNPVITESGMRCGIYGITVKILRTTNGDTPRNVRFMVTGCYAPSENN